MLVVSWIFQQKRVDKKLPRFSVGKRNYLNIRHVFSRHVFFIFNKIRDRILLVRNTIQLEYKNPKKIKGSFIWRVNSKFLSNSNLRVKLGTNLEDQKLLEKLIRKFGKDKLYFTSGDENKNKFFIWFSRVKEWENQREVKMKYNIQPIETYKDEENDNLIDFFDFSEKLNKKIQLRINFNFDVYETQLQVNSADLKEYNRTSSLYKRYTKIEKYLEQTEEIKKLAKNIIGKERDYFKRARKIFYWITENITYKYPPQERGVIPTLKNKCGDCGEFSFVFISLCRSVGIPARFVSGMWATPIKKQEFHAWAEFYLENIGWIPVDCSVSQTLKMKTNKEFIRFLEKIENPLNPGYYFGNLDNKRIIFSKGNNILLKNCPKKLSKLKMMENCRTLFMQPSSIYPFVAGKRKGIFIIEINPELNIL